MSIVNKYITSILKEERCFKLWVELGSLKKVSEHLKSEGIINPKTVKPFTAMGIRFAAYRWVLQYPDKAKPIYYAEGFTGSDDDWNLYLIKVAKNNILNNSVTIRPFVKFIKENNFERYEYFYEDWIKEKSVKPLLE